MVNLGSGAELVGWIFLRSRLWRWWGLDGFMADTHGLPDGSKVTVESLLVEEGTMSIHSSSTLPRNSTGTDTQSIAQTMFTTPNGSPPNNSNSTASSGSGLTGFKLGRSSGSGSLIRHGRIGGQLHATLVVVLGHARVAEMLVE